MPRKRIIPDSIKEAVEEVIPFLEDMSNNAYNAIYFDGWSGLGASEVLRRIAKMPPPSLLQRFNEIIHIDCSRWKSRRALQRTIAQEINLPHQVMDIFDRQDEEDDFKGIDEAHRAEIQDIGIAINQHLRDHVYLVIFHNGSDKFIDLNDFGIPQQHFDRWSTNFSKVLWTFRGRLRLNPEISEKVDHSHLCLYDEYSAYGWNYLLKKEAKDIVGYTYKLVNAVEECFLYILSLKFQGGNFMNYNWDTHASNYWVCDGIIQGDKDHEAWELAVALHQQIHIEDFSFNAPPSLIYEEDLKTPPKRWILGRDNFDLHPESTSYFHAAATRNTYSPLRPLPINLFQQSGKLRVLKLCHCTFNFTSPPFHCCRNLRFLGLDGCKDQGAKELIKQDKPAMELFQNLWVLDICYTDWELYLSPEIIQQMAENIREVHIENGRFWHMSFAWRQLQNLHKLRVIDPTCCWETGGMDEFNVLPSLSTSNSLKTMVLNGCVELEYVEGLPLSLESFILDAGTRKDDYKDVKTRHISTSGCARLSEFKLHGSLPNLEKLDLSGTKIKTLDLRAKVVQVPCLKQVILLGCENLRAILWPEMGMPQLSLVCIDTREGEVEWIKPDTIKVTKGYCQTYVAMVDMRFIQLMTNYKDFYENNNMASLNICISATSTDGQRSCNKDKMRPSTCGKISGTPLQNSLISKPSCNTYTDVTIDNRTIDPKDSNTMQFQELSYHVEIGEGISNTIVENLEEINAIIYVMNKTKSLHVHDNSSITTVIPENIVSIQGRELDWRHLKRCHVVRCPKMHTVFITSNFSFNFFDELESLWVADLLMARRILNNGMCGYWLGFLKLQSICLHTCPRLTCVLPLTSFPNLETLHIINCGDLKEVFHMEHYDLAIKFTDNREVRHEFPKLKHIYLHELYKLQHICEAKMFAPHLETVKLRGCWGLRRIPALGHDNGRRPIVDCEKDWWDKLEWDGLEVGHDPSLFQPHHSSYYKKPIPRVSVLR
uniref:Uncharacterized protein n=1 Tax=Avena sativa TaxID=4498 RepID=A0ACD5WRL4_AVESA